MAQCDYCYFNNCKTNSDIIKKIDEAEAYLEGALDAGNSLSDKVYFNIACMYETGCKYRKKKFTGISIEKAKEYFQKSYKQEAERRLLAIYKNENDIENYMLQTWKTYNFEKARMIAGNNTELILKLAERNHFDDTAAELYYDAYKINSEIGIENIIQCVKKTKSIKACLILCSYFQEQKDIKKIIKYGKIAAQQGNEDSILILQNIYYTKPEKYSEIISVMEECSASGYVKASSFLAKELTGDERIKYLLAATSQGDPESKNVIDKEAENGTSELQIELAKVYCQEKNAFFSISEATKLFLKAIQAGNKQAIKYLQELGETGFGHTFDIEKGKINKLKNKESLDLVFYELGKLYFDGKFVEKDLIKAFSYFNRCENDIIADVHYYLGLYTSGKLESELPLWFNLEHPKDETKALEHFKLASTEANDVVEHRQYAIDYQSFCIDRSAVE